MWTETGLKQLTIGLIAPGGAVLGQPMDADDEGFAVVFGQPPRASAANTGPVPPEDVTVGPWILRGAIGPVGDAGPVPADPVPADLGMRQPDGAVLEQDAASDDAGDTRAMAEAFLPLMGWLPLPKPEAGGRMPDAATPGKESDDVGANRSARSWGQQPDQSMPPSPVPAPEGRPGFGDEGLTRAFPAGTRGQPAEAVAGLPQKAGDLAWPTRPSGVPAEDAFGSEDRLAARSDRGTADLEATRKSPPGSAQLLAPDSTGAGPGRADNTPGEAEGNARAGAPQPRYPGTDAPLPVLPAGGPQPGDERLRDQSLPPGQSAQSVEGGRLTPAGPGAGVFPTMSPAPMILPDLHGTMSGTGRIEEGAKGQDPAGSPQSAVPAPRPDPAPGLAGLPARPEAGVPPGLLPVATGAERFRLGLMNWPGAPEAEAGQSRGDATAPPLVAASGGPALQSQSGSPPVQTGSGAFGANGWPAGLPDPLDRSLWLDGENAALGLSPAGQPATAGSSPAAGPLPGGPVPQLAAGIAAALIHRADGTTEVVLSPDELGSVRLRLEADARDPDRMIVHLVFDRPETMDLFRRHADQLSEAIRAAGYSEARLDFGQQGSGDSAGSGQEAAGRRTDTAIAEATNMTGWHAREHNPDKHFPLRLADAAGLDLRL